jgi:hypothetical protein
MSPIAANDILAPDSLSLSRFFAFRNPIVGIVLFGCSQERSEEAICGLVSELRWCSFVFTHVSDSHGDRMRTVIIDLAFIDGHLFGHDSSLHLDSSIGDFCNRVQEMALNATLTGC